MGKYELFQDGKEEWRWHLKARNGEIVCWAEGYSSKQKALESIEWNKENAAAAEIFEL